MPDASVTKTLAYVAGAEGYALAVHIWEPPLSSKATLILLHGVVSHAAWLAPIAQLLAAGGLRVICPDRRGAGSNTVNIGDAPDVATLVQDVVQVASHFADDDEPLHVGGFCWGATYMINVLQSNKLGAQSLIMIAPSIFPAEDVAGAELVVGESGDATEVPNVPIDRFTSGPAYEDFIVPDTRRTHYVSPRFNGILVAMNRMLAPRWAKLGMPTLMVLAEDDRLSDNAKHQRAFASLKKTENQCVMLPGEHGLQFDSPEQTAAAIIRWTLRA